MRTVVACWLAAWGRPAQKWQLEQQLNLVSLFVALLFYLLHLVSSFPGVSLGGASVVVCLRWHYCPSHPTAPSCAAWPLSWGAGALPREPRPSTARDTPPPSRPVRPRLRHPPRLPVRHPPVPVPDGCRQRHNTPPHDTENHGRQRPPPRDARGTVPFPVLVAVAIVSRDPLSSI